MKVNSERFCKLRQRLRSVSTAWCETMSLEWNGTLLFGRPWSWTNGFEDGQPPPSYCESLEAQRHMLTKAGIS